MRVALIATDRRISHRPKRHAKAQEIHYDSRVPNVSLQTSKESLGIFAIPGIQRTARDRRPAGAWLAETVLEYHYKIPWHKRPVSVGTLSSKGTYLPGANHISSRSPNGGPPNPDLSVRPHSKSQVRLIEIKDSVPCIFNDRVDGAGIKV